MIDPKVQATIDTLLRVGDLAEIDGLPVPYATAIQGVGSSEIIVGVRLVWFGEDGRSVEAEVSGLPYVGVAEGMRHLSLYGRGKPAPRGGFTDALRRALMWLVGRVEDPREGFGR